MEQANIIGYHGTSQSCADMILIEKQFRVSSSTKEWLGEGIYFFEDRNHAIGWANIRSKRYGEKFAVVLAVDILCSSEEFFDLDIPINVFQIDKCFMQAMSNGDFGNGTPQFESIDELRCFATNFYKETHPDIKVIAYTFDSTQHTKAGFPIKQRQLCVSDQDIISNIRKVYTAETGRGGYYRG